MNPEKDLLFVLPFLWAGQPWFLVVPREGDTVEVAEDLNLRFMWVSSMFLGCQGKQARDSGFVAWSLTPASRQG